MAGSAAGFHDDQLRLLDEPGSEHSRCPDPPSRNDIRITVDVRQMSLAGRYFGFPPSISMEGGRKIVQRTSYRTGREDNVNLTRKDFLKLATIAFGVSAVGIAAGGSAASGSDGGHDELRPVNGIRAVLNAMDRYPLLGIGDNHMCEQSHVFLRSLVQYRAVQDKINDIVVEFGNALYQDTADRFFLDLGTVDYADIATMWRNTIGGRVYWDAPVYEQFYRTVRSINEKLPRERRIRVVLGDVDIDWSQIRSVADAGKLPPGDRRETFYAEVVEREVLAKERRALLVVGGNHLRRGIHTGPSDMSPPLDPNQPSAGTLLANRHPRSLFVILPYTAVSAAIHSLPPGIPERLAQTLASWTAPSIATLAKTWLGPQTMSDRALDPNSTFQDQADAILWLGPDEALTCARADPALYRSGDYAAELQRRSEVLTQITGNTIDLIDEGLHLASLGPSCSER
jgi:hypothetical protein